MQATPHPHNIYLDNAATEKPLRCVVEHIQKNIGTLYGNPSSTHKIGMAASSKIEDTRNSLASFLSCRSDEIYFTSSGTEADNLAIFGTVSAHKRKGNRIITTDSEHPAVLNSCKELENAGFEVIYLPTKGGEVDLDMLKSSLNEKTILVSIMITNNETGAVYDIERASEIVAAHKKSQVLFHCDAVQSLCRQKIDLTSLPVDMMSVSAHKIGGLKGTGALFLRKGKRIKSRIEGGGQEKGLRSSTENLTGIGAFGKAVEFYKVNFGTTQEHLKNLHEYTLEKLKNTNAKVNLPKKNCNHIVSLILPEIRSEIMLNYLSDKGIYVSAGSACSSRQKNKTAGYVLSAFGLTQKEVDSVIRVSFSHENTMQDIDVFVLELKKAAERLT